MSCCLWSGVIFGLELQYAFTFSLHAMQLVSSARALPTCDKFIKTITPTTTTRVTIIFLISPPPSVGISLALQGESGTDHDSSDGSSGYWHLQSSTHSQ